MNENEEKTERPNDAYSGLYKSIKKNEKVNSDRASKAVKKSKWRTAAKVGIPLLLLGAGIYEGVIQPNKRNAALYARGNLARADDDITTKQRLVALEEGKNNRLKGELGNAKTALEKARGLERVMGYNNDIACIVLAEEGANSYSIDVEVENLGKEITDLNKKKQNIKNQNYLNFILNRMEREFKKNWNCYKSELVWKGKLKFKIKNGVVTENYGNGDREPWFITEISDKRMKDTAGYVQHGVDCK